MLPHEYKANAILNDYVKASRARWLKDWGEGLAHCHKCDHEFTDLQEVEIEGVKCCPNCKESAGKTYYYCNEHGSPGCKECED
jgi:predicted Zn-ribbon and HTH transcriptional regulator